MRKGAAVLVCLAALAVPSVDHAFAAGAEDALVALRAVTSELQVCAAYYAIASRCSTQRQPKLSDRFAKSSTRLQGLARRGKQAVSDSTFNAQSILLLSVLLSATDNDCENLSVLTDSYEKFCSRLDGNFDARFNEWVKCARNNQSDCGGQSFLKRSNAT
jgi:hypothetical protein